MILGLPVVLALSQRCASGIAPEAMISIVSVESNFDPLAINVNHVGSLHPRTAAEAIEAASRFIRAGYSVDLGLAQINARNLSQTGLRIATAFDPCANLAAAEKILRLGYARASRGTSGIEAISRTFSLYNSGNLTTGFRNNYVARVWAAAEKIVPQIRRGSALPAAFAALARPAVLPPSDPPSFVISPADTSVLVFK